MKPKRKQKSLKPLPAFDSEDAERNFWGHEDSTHYLDWPKGRRVTFPNLKPSVRTISVRLPVPMINRLKLLANRRDIPYQSLLKMLLAQQLEREYHER
jgi:predicted DNA binding CopG/RHH family protein